MAGIIAFAWLLTGIAFAGYVWRRHPARARATERVFVDESARMASGRTLDEQPVP